MIWYACYGSNMDMDRFLKYIKGGQIVVNGETKNYTACPTDTSVPQKSEPYLIDRKFYFGNKSKTWGLHGVGFISNQKNKKSKTYAKLYLISPAQFSHLFAQENSRKTSIIDYKKLTEEKALDFDYNFYNRIILLAENHKGYPIVTFTSKINLKTNSPHLEYAKLISNGLRMTHKLTGKEALQYLIKPGTGAKKKDLKTIAS